LIIELRDAGAFDFKHPGDLIRSASRQELEEARIGARAFWDGLINVAKLAVHGHGRDAAGLGLFPLTRKRDFYWRIAMITRFWLLLPGLASEQHLTELVEAIEANRAKLAAVSALIEAFPGYKQFFTENGEERLAALSPEEREQVSRDIGGFIDTHPQARCLLENQVEFSN
jgi:hypothetical protein